MTPFQAAPEPAPQTRDDRGVAMILVMGWSLLMMGLVLVVSQLVLNQIVPSDRSEKSYAALSAAEAGLADLDGRLQVGTIDSVVADATNLALRGWVPVPGGNTNSEFTYAIDATKAGAIGEVRAYAIGRSGGVTRVLEAVLSKRSTLDYVYMSDRETPSPDTPGVYSTSQYGSSGYTYQEAARLLCDRRWAEPGPVTIGTNGQVAQGNQRNLQFCGWAGIFGTERLLGPMHTNDVWWLQNTDLSSALDEGGLTSGCRTPDEGLAAGEVGCPSGHRYIVASFDSAGYSSAPSGYQGDSWRPTGTDITQRNPLYAPVLDLPPDPDLLKQRAAESGCIYTGPTRIRFAEESGIGYMYVTSPDTKLTAAGCDGEGGNGTQLQSPATAQVTRRVKLNDFSDLVIFVQDVRPSTEGDVAGVDYDDPAQKYYWERANRWTPGGEPTCTVKSGKKYPYVIPDDPAESGYYGSGSTRRGFPSELADPASPWYGSACASGDLYVQGSYQGTVTVTTDNNVVLTGSLRDADLLNPSAVAGAVDYGQPHPQSQNVLGIAAGRFAYVYRPLTTAGSWVADWRTSNAENPIFDFALLAIQQCFGAQDHGQGVYNGNIYLWGSIAQKFRCAVGVGGSSPLGYGKVYKYDDRLVVRTPPYMLELSEEPWATKRVGALTTDSQSVNEAVTRDLLRPDDGDATVDEVTLASAPNAGTVTLTTVGSEVTMASAEPGLVVVTYEVVTADAREVRRQVVLVE